MKRAITMRAALADPGLLGGALVGELWSTWRAFLIAIMGERLTAAEREIFRRFTGGRGREPGERVEEAAFIIGRRGGKDRGLAAPLAVYLAALVDWSSVLATGERGLVLCIGADVRQARIQRNYIEGILSSSPILSALIINRTADAIELSNGITIEVRAASFRTNRGPTCVACIITELAFLRDETSANADVEILNAVRPSLATTGGPLIMISTPYARRGALWEIFRRNYGPDGDPLILVVQGASRDFNPVLPQRVVDRALERDPAAARAEYLGIFREDVSGWAPREQIEASVDHGVTVRPPRRGVNYISFCDPSGGSRDSFTAAVAHGEDGVFHLDCMVEVRSPFNPDEATAQISATLKSYGINRTTSDKYAAAWPVAAFARNGIRLEHSERDRSAIYSDALPLFTTGRARLLDNQKLVGQFSALERRTSSAGRDRIDHGPGGHDDLCNAAAGALVLAGARSSRVLTPGYLERLSRAGRYGDAGVSPSIAALRQRLPIGERAQAQLRAGIMPSFR